MKYLKISNEGLLDIRLVYLMGGTTKANDKFKIGQFGTGLKYTLAFMMRNNIDFQIYIGGKQLVLSVEKEIIRDTSFEIICIDGQRTSITTNMGTDWLAWMVIRELWCNALDETGAAFEITDTINPSVNTTEYYIQLVPDISKVYENWDKYFIHDKTPIMDCEKFAIYEGGDSLRCYKNGVLVHEQQNESSVFSYDIKDVSLNELREMRGSACYEIAECFPYFDANTVDILLNNIKDKYEENIDISSYSWVAKFGEGWKQAIGSAKFIDYETYDKIIDRHPDLANQAVVKVPKNLFKQLIKAFPSISMLRASSQLNEFFETYSETLHDKVKKCLDLLSRVGYFIDPNLRIIYGIFGDKQLVAQVSFDDKEIRLNQDLESMPDSELIQALIEENEHYKTGFQDCTRSFQSHFIKLYSNLLLKDVRVLI